MHLAQINIAKALYPLDDPRMAEFTGRIAAINALAEKAPGFVWRLVDEDGEGATGIQAFEDPNMLVNMSVWEDVQSLYDFVFLTAHKTVMRRNKDNFPPLSAPHMALWWIEEGHIPTLDEAKDKLAGIERDGPAPEAFNFKQGFDAQGAKLNPNRPGSGVVDA